MVVSCYDFNSIKPKQTYCKSWRRFWESRWSILVAILLYRTNFFLLRLSPLHLAILGKMFSSALEVQVNERSISLSWWVQKTRSTRKCGRGACPTCEDNSLTRIALFLIWHALSVEPAVHPATHISEELSNLKPFWQRITSHQTLRIIPLERRKPNVVIVNTCICKTRVESNFNQTCSFCNPAADNVVAQ